MRKIIFLVSFLCLAAFFLNSISLPPHYDIYGSISRAYSVHMSGGWSHFFEFWEHRPIAYSFFIQVIFEVTAWITGQTSGSVFFLVWNLLWAVFPILTVWIFISSLKLPGLSRWMMLLIALLIFFGVTASIWMQPEYLAAIFTVCAFGLFNLGTKFTRPISYFFFAVAFSMKLVTGIYGLAALFVLNGEKSLVNARAIRNFLFLAGAYFSFATLVLLIYPRELDDLMIDAFIQGAADRGLVLRIILFFAKIPDFFRQFPILFWFASSLALSILIFRKSLQFQKKKILILLSVCLMISLVNLIQVSSFHYQYSGFMLLPFFIFYLYKNDLQDFIDRLDSTQIPFGKRALIISAALFLVVVTVINLTAESKLLDEYNSKYSDFQAWSETVKIQNKLGPASEVLYLVPAVYSGWFHQKSQCRAVFGVFVQRSKHEVVYQRIKSLKPYLEFKKCIQSPSTQFVLHDSEWLDLSQNKDRILADYIEKNFKEVSRWRNLRALVREGR